MICASLSPAVWATLDVESFDAEACAVLDAWLAPADDEPDAEAAAVEVLDCEEHAHRAHASITAVV